jgi:hypothetical protein
MLGIKASFDLGCAIDRSSASRQNLLLGSPVQVVALSIQ